MSTTDAVPAALAAFVRGNERRAWTCLWLQCGRPESAGQALAATLRAFQSQAARLPMAQWPDRFWRLLAAAPVGADGDWPEPLAWLATLETPPRRALLLRLAAGLDEAAAAAAMAVGADAYRDLLARACPRDAAGEADPLAWRALAQAIQQAGRDLSPQRLVRIAELREAALAGQPLAVTAGTPAAARPVVEADRDPHHPLQAPARRRRGPWIVAVLLLCALALAATWWFEPVRQAVRAGGDTASGAADAEEDDLRVHDTGPIEVEPLPEDAAAVAAPALPPAMDDTPLDPQVARFDLIAWYAAGAPASRIDRDGEVPAVAAAQPPAGSEDPDGLRAAWAGLDATEQHWLRETDAVFAALPASEQAGLRARFAALDGMERRGWRLGPSLGADYPALQTLVGYAGEDERTALLAALRALTPAQRAQLAALGRRTPADARASLRAALVAQPAERRAAWLEQRAAQ